MLIPRFTEFTPPRPRYPEYHAGMSVVEYVRRYEIMNHLKPTV